MADDFHKSLNEEGLPFSDYLGVVYTTATKDLVCAELTVRQELCTRPDILHGGAVMALADNLGAVGTVLNLPEGAFTTTLESKTNFISAIPMGQKALAECTPIHRGRTTMVWQTRISREDGKLAAIVTQTQMVMNKN